MKVRATEKSDLLFQISGDGSVAIWFTNGVTMTLSQYLNLSNPGDSWKIVVAP